MRASSVAVRWATELCCGPSRGVPAGLRFALHAYASCLSTPAAHHSGRVTRAGPETAREARRYACHAARRPRCGGRQPSAGNAVRPPLVFGLHDREEGGRAEKLAQRRAHRAKTPIPNPEHTGVRGPCSDPKGWRVFGWFCVVQRPPPRFPHGLPESTFYLSRREKSEVPAEKSEVPAVL